MRLKIVKGVAKVIEFLHYHIQRLVIHLNISPSNVLLGEGFQPKLSGFQMSVYYRGYQIQMDMPTMYIRNCTNKLPEFQYTICFMSIPSFIL